MSRYQPLSNNSRNNATPAVRLTKEVIMRIFTVSRQPGRLLYLLVAVSLLLGMVGPAEVRPCLGTGAESCPAGNNRHSRRHSYHSDLYNWRYSQLEPHDRYRYKPADAGGRVLEFRHYCDNHLFGHFHSLWRVDYSPKPGHNAAEFLGLPLYRDL